jgi:hypothetical protein
MPFKSLSKLTLLTYSGRGEAGGEEEDDEREEEEDDDDDDDERALRFRFLSGRSGDCEEPGDADCRC